MKNKNLGFDDEQIFVTMLKPGQDLSDRAAFIDQVKSNPNIIAVSVSSSVPGRNTGVNAFIPEGFSETSSFILEMLRVDYTFINTYKLEVLEGRAFSQEMITDSASALMINEEAARILGWTHEEAIGKGMKNITTNLPDKYIIGIIKDYHHKSLKESIEPMIFDITPRGRYTSFKVSTENLLETISFIEEKWNEFWPEMEIAHFFVDDNFNNLYQSEEKLSNLFKSFAFLAILISCLGLYALTAYTAELRTKEIGIRKVLGADRFRLIMLMQKSYLGVIIIASLVTLPIVYYIMSRWLNNFAFKTEINPWLYLFSISVVFVLSLLTTAYHTYKTIRANPVDSLRYE
jgi:putative ABC transport system permease protein